MVVTDTLVKDPRRAGGGEDLWGLSLATVILRRRRQIFGIGIAGAAVGLIAGLTSTRVYVSGATFIPQTSEGNVSSLAAAATQFGIRLPSSAGGWGPPVYVELLRSWALLKPLALDTVAVAEEGGHRVSVMDLLKVNAPNPQRRVELTVRRLAGIVQSREVRALGAVDVTVTTKWPSVSFQLANRLVTEVNQFNLEKRKSQAAAERQFVEAQTLEAERALRDAEDRLQEFLQRNRVTGGASELAFQRDRLQREVALRQQLYTSLAQSREEARSREVRDTPVITVLEEPRLPVVPESRRVALKTALGALMGGLIGLVLAFVADGLAGARRTPDEKAREFFDLVEEVTPRVFRRKRS